MNQTMTRKQLSLSTMWNYPWAKNGEGMIRSIHDLGFGGVELNYQVKPEFLPGIQAALSSTGLLVSSIHNVFPKVTDQRFGTDSVLLGSLEEDLRRQAVELTKGSIDWAWRLGAKAVVIHPSEVPLDPAAYDLPLKKLLQQGEVQSPEYQQLLEKLMSARQAKPYLEALRNSLVELSDYIAQKGYAVFLGLENRSMVHQIPLLDEYLVLEDLMQQLPVKIWLDSGHAIMMAELGLQQLPLADSLRKYVKGMHLHEAVLGKDHYPPGSLPGDPLADFLPLFLASPVKVLEISSRVPAEELIQGVDWLVERMNSFLQRIITKGQLPNFDR